MGHRILILGSSGLLGQTLVSTLKKRAYLPLQQTRILGGPIVCDPSSFFDLRKTILDQRPDGIINLIGATNVDRCEFNLEYAYAGNVAPSANLAAVVQSLKIDVPVIHISTDHVYDGIGFKAEENIHIVNQYALSKYASEAPILSVGGIVLRTNFFGRSKSPGRISLTDWIYDALVNKEAVTVFSDVMISALHSETLAELIIEIYQHPKPGIFNIGISGGYSKADLAFGIASRLNLDTQHLTCGRFSEANSKVRRPKDMRMNSQKFLNTYGIELPDFVSQLDRAAKEYM